MCFELIQDWIQLSGHPFLAVSLDRVLWTTLDFSNGSEKMWHPVFDLPQSAVKRDGWSAEVCERRLSMWPQEAEWHLIWQEDLHYGIDLQFHSDWIDVCKAEKCVNATQLWNLQNVDQDSDDHCSQKIVQPYHCSLRNVFLCVHVVSSPTMTTNTKLALCCTF